VIGYSLRSSGAANVGVRRSGHRQSSGWGVRHPTILVYFVPCF